MRRVLLLALGYGLGVFAGSALVARLLRRVVGAGEPEEIAAFRRNGLPRAGAFIGGLERFLVITFVLAGSYPTIGFVIAAKGVMRFGEVKDAASQRVAEYILVGSMLSISWGILVGEVLRRVL